MKYTLYHNVDRRRHVDNIWGEYRAGDRLAPYYSGDVDVPNVDGTRHCPAYRKAAEALFMRHNRDSRPCGRLGPSLSIGDVIVFHDGFDRYAYATALEGFDAVDVESLNPLPQTYLQWLDDERNTRAAR